MTSDTRMTTMAPLKSVKSALGNHTQQKEGPFMPPPERGEAKKKGRKNKPMSVYPGGSIAGILGGFGSSLFGKAMWCWAHVIEEAQPEVAALFSPREWALLALSVAGKEMDFEPMLGNPGENLCQYVERAGAIGLADVLGRGQEQKLGELLQKVKGLTYVQAWAVIFTLIYRASHGFDVSSEGWWSLSHRREHARPPAGYA